MPSFFPTPTRLLAGTSTRWPAHTSLAIPLLYLSVLPCTAHAALLLTLGIKLLSLPPTTYCYNISGPDGYLAYPLVFGNLETFTGDVLAMGAGQGAGVVIYTTLLSPALVLALLAAHCTLHIRPARLSNRAAVLAASVTATLLLVSAVQAACLGPPLRRLDAVTSESTVTCWLRAGAFEAVRRQGQGRWVVVVWSVVCAGIAGLWLLIYTLLTLSATTHNARASSANDTRLQNLTRPKSPSRSPNTPSHNPDPDSRTPSLQGLYANSDDEDGDLGTQQGVWSPLEDGGGGVVARGDGDAEMEVRMGVSVAEREREERMVARAEARERSRRMGNELLELELEGQGKGDV